MEMNSIQKKKIPTFFEEEIQEMESPTASSSFKIPSFFLKTFRKRFDYSCNNEDNSEIDKKKWLIELTSMLYKFFGGAKFSTCYRIGGKIDGGDDDSSSESEADESMDGSETAKKFPADEKVSSQSKLPVSILDVFSKKNAMDFSFNFNFDFIKSRICKGKNSNRSRNLGENESGSRLTAFGSGENLKRRLLQIPSRERREMRENSRAISYDDENGERELWQKRILMGGKCKPLLV